MGWIGANYYPHILTTTEFNSPRIEFTNSPFRGVHTSFMGVEIQWNFTFSKPLQFSTDDQLLLSMFIWLLVVYESVNKIKKRKEKKRKKRETAQH